MNKFKTILWLSITAVAFTGCSGNKDNNEGAGETDNPQNVASSGLAGQWLIESIVFNDSVYVRPQEEVPGSNQRINFTENSYTINTNCNVICGDYSLHGDSLTFHPGAMTEVACDNMATEEAMCRILPDISSLSVQNDTVVRLDCRNPSAYILLHKVEP